MKKNRRPRPGYLRRLSRLRRIVARLRGPRGCPWDRKQTFESVRSFVIEEAHEIVEAIDRRDGAHLREELGDVLFHVLFLTLLAEEKGLFGLSEVIDGISEKLVRRHPHVFGGGAAMDADEVERSWEKIKAREKGSRRSVGEGIPKTLPALIRACRISERAARVGFDWDDSGGVFRKLAEETRELKQELSSRDFKKPRTRAAAARRRVEHELGDMLFVLANLSRHLSMDPERALNACTDRFCARFDAMQREARDSGKTLEEMSPAGLERAWQRAKKPCRSRFGVFPPKL